jgi:hypothetical protein
MGSQQGGSRPSYAETSNYWDGVKDFNRESLLSLDPTLKEQKRRSDSSAEYSEYFKQADKATKLADSNTQESLKLYKAIQSTATPHERWDTTTSGWPDRACALTIGENDHGTPTEIDLPEDASGFIEIDKREDSEELPMEELMKSVRKQSDTLRSGNIRVRRDKQFRIRKSNSRHR